MSLKTNTSMDVHNPQQRSKNMRAIHHQKADMHCKVAGIYKLEVCTNFRYKYYIYNISHFWPAKF